MKKKEKILNIYRRTSRKGIVGIESAIVLIAFVVVAAALAFVVLNMGFFTTQRSKETIGSGLAQSSSALEIDGTVLAQVDTVNQKIECLVIPLRLSAGQKPVDLTPNKTTVSVWVLGRFADINVYYDASQAVKSVAAYDISTLCSTPTIGGQNVNASIIWLTGNNNDNVLDAGEKALLVITFAPASEPEAYDVVKAEIRVSVGAALTVERTIPASLTEQVIDLG